MLKIRRSHDRLIFNLGIPIPVKDGLYIETGPSMLSCLFQVYAVDSASTMKEPVGYVVLDLRSAQQQQVGNTHEWIKLANFRKEIRSLRSLTLLVYC